MSFQLCRHIKTTGVQCQSPQLRGGDFCFFHERLIRTHRRVSEPLVSRRAFHLGPTEDIESVQIGISSVINALAADTLELRRATALLYGLQLASVNAVRLGLLPHHKQLVPETDSENPDIARIGAVSTKDEEDAAFAKRYLEPIDHEDEDDDEED